MRPIDFIFEVIFPDATGFGQLIHYFGIDFDVEDEDEEKYYFLLDEVQLMDEFVSVLNGLADKKNCDVL